MEGSALFAEANFKRIPGVVIKGICDWGAVKNETEKKVMNERDKKDAKGTVAGERFRSEGSECENKKNTDGELPNSVTKHGMQAYAMKKAIEQCSRLLDNPYLFDKPKNEKLIWLIKDVRFNFWLALFLETAAFIYLNLRYKTDLFNQKSMGYVLLCLLWH